MTEAAFWWVHTVTIEPYLGETGIGPKYGPPQVGIECWVEDEITLVRDSTGSQVVSSGKVRGPVEIAAIAPPKSRVTTSTRTAFVITTNVLDSGSLALELDHVELSLT